MPRPLVRVVGVALAVGCHPVSPLTQNPPEPMVSPVVAPVQAPPDAPVAAPVTTLPTWESVVSGHPEGATNPPSALLIVSKNPEACFKGWLPGMIRPDDEVMDIHGRVVETPAQAGTATQVQCPSGQPQTLLEAAAKRNASK